MTQIIESIEGAEDSGQGKLDCFRYYKGYSISDPVGDGLLWTRDTLVQGGRIGWWETAPAGTQDASYTQGYIAPTATLTDTVRGVFYNLDPADPPNTLLTSFNDLWFSSWMSLRHTGTFTHDGSTNFYLEGRVILETIDEPFDPSVETFATIINLNRTTVIDPLSYLKASIGPASASSQNNATFASAESHAGDGQNLNMIYHSQAISCYGLIFRFQAASQGEAFPSIGGAVTWSEKDGTQTERLGQFNNILQNIATLFYL